MINQQPLMKVPTQPQKRKWKKVVLIIVSIIAILIIGVLLLLGFSLLSAKDIAPINDSDLRLQKMLIPGEDNSYFDLIKLENAMFEPDGKSQAINDMVLGGIWDDKLAEEVVLHNTQAFDYFAEAASKPKFQNLISANSANVRSDEVLVSMNSWRRMTRLSAIRAMYLAKQGKDKEAIDEALNSVNIGQKIQESQPTLAEYIVARTMKEIGLETVQKIIPSIKLSSVESKQYAQELDKYYKNEDGLINSFKDEYQIQSRSIDEIRNKTVEVLEEDIVDLIKEPEIIEKIENNYYFQLNKTKSLLAEYIRTSIKDVNEPCGKTKAIEVQKLTPTNLVKFLMEENAIGKKFYDSIIEYLARTHIEKCGEDLLVGVTQAMIAIKTYKNDTGSYPASLDDLVPEYLSSIPQDPFDGKLLKYSITKTILYSVGKDIQDSGGSVGDDWRTMLDPTFKINF